MTFRSNSIPNEFFDVSGPPDGFSGGDFFFGFLIEFFRDAFHRLRRDPVFLEDIIPDPAIEEVLTELTKLTE